MAPLSGFWHGAAALSGRIDLSPATQSGSELESLSDTELTLLGIHRRHLKRIRSSPSLPDPGASVVMGCEQYPRRLALLPFAPPVLFLQGDVSLLRKPTVAIVGARRCTQRGREMAADLAHGLARSGLYICSGLAYGIDEAAHMACPQQSIAVLGQGWDAPMSHRLKRGIERIVGAGGLVITEFLPNIPASKYTFPQRNRIISGLSVATIVVEASLRSGSQITARHALEQGRDVMAVPGHPRDPMSVGCNALIAQGAALIQSPADALAVLGFSASPQPLPEPGCEIQRQVIEALKTGETLDHVASVTGQHIPALIVAIQELELTGHLGRLPGDRLRLQETQ